MDTDVAISSCDEAFSTAETKKTRTKKRRVSSTVTLTQLGDELPPKYQHIRESIRKARVL